MYNAYESYIKYKRISIWQRFYLRFITSGKIEKNDDDDDDNFEII